MPGLPYREIWAADFEFIANPGGRPDPVCMVARELRSGRLIRLWQDDLPGQPPFRVDDGVLFVAYMAAAELGCFLELGWPVPARILDLYVEFRAATNGAKPPGGYGLLSALSFHGLPGITSEQKESGRELVMRGGPWSASERREVLEYCQTDVDCLGPLLERMTPAITARPASLGQALLRGRYMTAVARMERTGVPVDLEMLEQLRQHWGSIKDDLVDVVDKDFGVFDGTVFKAAKFGAWLAGEGIPWPLTDRGHLCLDRDTFSDMAKVHPKLEPLKQLRRTLSDLRLERLAVGPDGRNRAPLWPFGARTGRNTPSANGFIFGPARWLRGLIKPAPGQAIAYVDWTFQEVAIAAALSGDQALLEAVGSGDPYLAFAKMAGLAAPDATRQSHAMVRDQCKTCVLGTNYGMGAISLAARLGVNKIHADHLLRLLARTFPDFSAWSDQVVDRALLTGQIRSEFGWPMHVTASSMPTALKNFPMQANGAEMLRIAASLATEQGIQVCAPVHDALLIEAPSGEFDQVVSAARAAMAEASRAVLDGLELDTDVVTVAWPERYADPRGQVMWDRVTGILERIGASAPATRPASVVAEELDGELANLVENLDGELELGEEPELSAADHMTAGTRAASAAQDQENRERT
jgi:DNA polymerase I